MPYLWRHALPLAFLFSLTTACSSAMDQQPNIKLNPHPRQRYELIVTVDAPGPWDKASASAAYEVSNVECTPKNTFEGVHKVPNTVRSFELTRVDDKTYRGYFYRDLLLDEDYFGLGVCHWALQSVGPDFKIHGEIFGADLTLQKVVGQKTETSYFKKKEYSDQSINNGVALEWPAYSNDSMEEVAKEPDAFFPITVTAKEVKP